MHHDSPENVDTPNNTAKVGKICHITKLSRKNPPILTD